MAVWHTKCACLAKRNNRKKTIFICIFQVVIKHTECHTSRAAAEKKTIISKTRSNHYSNVKQSECAFFSCFLVGKGLSLECGGCCFSLSLPSFKSTSLLLWLMSALKKKNKNALTATSCSHIERGAPLNCNKINLNEQKFVSYSYSYVYILTLIVCLSCTFSTYELSCNDMKTRKNNPVIITIHFVAFVRKRKKQFVLEQVHFTYIHTTLERNT